MSDHQSNVPMSEYPLAINYLREKSKTSILTEIFDLHELENILTDKSMEEYEALKESIYRFSKVHIRSFKHLYDEWLNDEISDLDIKVYKGQFEPGQDIKYFQDYFDNVKINESRNTKGLVQELKAYGQSQKINREIIAFEGKFYDGKLSTYDDRRGDADGYVNKHFSFHFNNTHPDRVGLLNSSNEVDYCENDIALLGLLASNNALDILSSDLARECLDYLFQDAEDFIKDLNYVVKQGDFVYDDQNQFYLPAYSLDSHQSFLSDLGITQEKKYSFPNQRDSYYKLSDITIAVKNHIKAQNHLDPSSPGAYFTKDEIAIILEKYPNSLYEQLTKQIGQIESTALSRIVQKVAIAQNQTTPAPVRVDETPPRKDDAPVIQSTRKGNGVKNLLYLIILLVGLYYFLPDQYKFWKKESGTSANTGTTAKTETSIPTQPGYYYVDYTNEKGINSWQNVLKTKTNKKKLLPMTKLNIVKVEDNVGYFDSFMDDNYNNVPEGWVEMDKLRPTSFVEKLEWYYVKSTMIDGIKLYKDPFKKTAHSIRAKPMQSITIIFQTDDSMGYFTNLALKNGGLVDKGWVDLNQMDKQ